MNQGTVRTFLLGRTVYPEMLDRFIEWGEGRESQDVHPEYALLAAFAGGMHPTRRAAFRRCAALHFRSVHVGAGLPVPEWIVGELATWAQLRPRNALGGGVKR